MGRVSDITDAEGIAAAIAATDLNTMVGKVAWNGAGVPPFAAKGAEAQLRHLTRKRALKLYDWLLELNLDLRGNSPLGETALLERFLLRLATKA